MIRNPFNRDFNVLYSLLFASFFLPSFAFSLLVLAFPKESPKIEQILDVVANVVRVLHRGRVQNVDRPGRRLRPVVAFTHGSGFGAFALFGAFLLGTAFAGLLLAVDHH